MLINKLFVLFTKNKMCILCSATNFIIFRLICTKNSAKIYIEIVDDDERAKVIVLNAWRLI